jgi:hypothetical protein
MHRLSLLLSLVALVTPLASAEPSDGSSGLEKLVTCDQGKAAQAAAVDLAQGHGFKIDATNSNFYVPTEKTTAFGFELHYAGLAGVMMQPGPNLTVEATIQAMKDRVQTATGLTFECGKIGCWHKLPSQQAVIIYPYKADPKFVTIQCGYYGE